MYGALWRVLPGPRSVKVVLLLLLAALVVVVCFVWVFPAIAPHLPFNDNTVDSPRPSASVPVAPLLPVAGTFR